jgi:enoyl-[acyl-carrier protein] reductase I
MSLIHSIAFAPKRGLEDGLLDCSADDFAKVISMPYHSLIRVAKLAALSSTKGRMMSR